MGGPDIPQQTPMPPAATMVDPTVLEERRRAKRMYQAKQGRQSTILTGPLGVKNPPTLGVPTLLGG